MTSGGNPPYICRTQTAVPGHCCTQLAVLLEVLKNQNTNYLVLSMRSTCFPFTIIVYSAVFFTAALPLNNHYGKGSAVVYWYIMRRYPLDYTCYTNITIQSTGQQKSLTYAKLPPAVAATACSIPPASAWHSSSK